MNRDVTFMMSEINGQIKFETSDKEFSQLNCTVKKVETFQKMLEIADQLNNSAKGCFGCLFCVE